MPAASPPSDRARPSRVGIRTRILLALFLAGAPGIVFGVLEAMRTIKTDSARAAFMALAPVIGVGLGMVAIWAAMDLWVLRWIRALEARARRAGASPMAAGTAAGAPPPEVAALANAFDDAAAANLRLTRELHHRVKNNLQVLLSLLARQQKRAASEAVRDALGQARARMLAIAIVHRFIDPPEDQGRIDLDAYLVELCRQLVTALSPDGRRLRIDTDLAPDILPIDVATVVGLLVAEAVISARPAPEPVSIVVDWSIDPRVLCVRFGEGHAYSADETLVRELARQAGGEARFKGDGLCVSWDPRPARPEPALTASAAPL